jgi:hypothetical protein
VPWIEVKRHASSWRGGEEGRKRGEEEERRRGGEEERRRGGEEEWRRGGEEESVYCSSNIDYDIHQ